MVELASTGQGVIACIVACSLANARFAPMVVSFLPLLQRMHLRLPTLVMDAQLLSINSWAMCLREFPRVDPDYRALYYRGFALTILCAALLGTLFGFHNTLLLPSTIILKLIFTSPLFFALVLSAVERRDERLALLFGAVLIVVIGPLLPDFDLVLTGLIGGSLAY